MPNGSGSPRRRERVYVLRIWREAGAPPESVRGSLEDVATREQHAFGAFGELADYLRRQLDAERHAV
jgi:hypothetical protein